MASFVTDGLGTILQDLLLNGGGGAAQLFTSEKFGPSFSGDGNGANWLFASPPPVAVDAGRLGGYFICDDSAKVAANFRAYVPVGATSMTFKVIHSVASPSGFPETVQLGVNAAGAGDGTPTFGPEPSWSAVFKFDPTDIPATASLNIDDYSVPLTTLGLTGGQIARIFFGRVATDPTDTLVGDWRLYALGLGFA